MSGLGTSGGSFQIDDILEILERRLKWIIAGAVVGLLAGLALHLAWPPIYAAKTTVLVEPQGVPENYIKSTVTLTLDRRLDTLSERVTSHDHLTDLIDRLGEEQLDPSGELSREALMGLIRANLTVGRGRGAAAATVFDISFQSTDPKLAATVAREITKSFISENVKDRTQQAAETAAFLDQELEGLREQMTSQEDRIRTFRFDKMGSLPSQLETNLRRIDQLNIGLASNLDAQVAASQQMALLRRQLEMASLTSVATLGSAGDLHALLLAARRELVEAELLYTEEHPNVQQLRHEIGELEKRIMAGKNEAGGEPILKSPTALAIEHEVRQAEIAVATRRREERRIRTEIAALQKRIDDTPRREEDLKELTRGYENLTATYHNLLGKKYEASLARNLEVAQKGEQFKLLRPASVPGTPIWPDPKVLLPGGLMFGLGFTALIIGFLEFRNPAFRSINRLTRTLGLPVFASIPRIDNDDIYESPVIDDVDEKLVVHTAPESSPAEQYRGFLPIFLDVEDCRVILVTSAARGDGKSLTNMNLAISLAADLNKRVLVIDGDLRRPSAHRLLHLTRKTGLSEILQGSASLSDCAMNSKIPNLTLLAAGPSVRNPLALLTSQAFLDLLDEAKKTYDIVMIDSPPLLPVVDTKILRKIADMVLFVVRADGTPRDAVTRSLGDLKGVAGVVFNQVSPGSYRRYYYHDAYSRYAYGDDVIEDRDDV